jgi:sulfite exporter TauE/SafE
LHHHSIPPSGDLLLLFLASFFGSAHCVGMCGPYVAMCASKLFGGGGSLLQRVLFNLARLGTYTLIGLLAGAFGEIALVAAEKAGLRGAISLGAGLLAIVLGCTLLGLARDPLVVLLKGGLEGFLRSGVGETLRRPSAWSTLSLGALQGLLPCALVYGAASRAAVAGSAWKGGLTMAIFGLGTFPAVFALTALSPGLVARFHGRAFSGVFVLAVGVLLVLRGLAGFQFIPATLFW